MSPTGLGGEEMGRGEETILTSSQEVGTPAQGQSRGRVLF